jgi:hypothetical protein
VSPRAGLAAGFGVRCGIVGARGMDENGAFFQSSLKRAHVSTEHLRVLKGGSTGTPLSDAPLLLVAIQVCESCLRKCTRLPVTRWPTLCIRVAPLVTCIASPGANPKPWTLSRSSAAGCAPQAVR